MQSRYYHWLHPANAFPPASPFSRLQQQSPTRPCPSPNRRGSPTPPCPAVQSGADAPSSVPDAGVGYSQSFPGCYCQGHETSTSLRFALQFASFPFESHTSLSCHCGQKPGVRKLRGTPQCSVSQKTGAIHRQSQAMRTKVHFLNFDEVLAALRTLTFDVEGVPGVA